MLFNFPLIGIIKSFSSFCGVAVAVSDCEWRVSKTNIVRKSNSNFPQGLEHHHTTRFEMAAIRRGHPDQKKLSYCVNKIQTGSSTCLEILIENPTVGHIKYLRFEFRFDGQNLKIDDDDDSTKIKEPFLKIKASFVI